MYWPQTTTSIPPLQMKMEKPIETTGRIPLTTQVQYTHTKSISCLEGSDAMRCKHIAKRVHLVTKGSLTFLFFYVCSFSSFIQQSWFPPMYKSTMTPLDFHTWFAVGFICGNVSTKSSRYPWRYQVLWIPFTFPSFHKKAYSKLCLSPNLRKAHIASHTSIC